MKRALLSIILSTIIMCAFAQTQGKTSVNGKVLESDSGEPLISATVMVMTPDSAKMLKGGITDSKGNFSIKNVDDGNYVLKVSYVGYHNFFRPIIVKHSTLSILNIGSIMMVPSNVELKAATVTAQVPEVEVKDDTLMFNADAFRVPEGSVLEDLVKKLPGVEVDENGTIKVNGKQVKKILVDGKEFFGTDQNMSMKNIPTEIIHKIKTYEKKSDLARLTGIDDGEEETVLDLTIKKGMKNSWIGNLGGSFGTKSRYNLRGQINRFQDNLQSNLITNFGNVNERGGTQNGNNINGQVGGRIMYNIPEKLEVGGNFRYNYRKNDNWTKSSSENYTNLRPSYQNSYNKNKSTNNSFSGDFKAEWKIDSVTTIIFRPNFSFGNSGSNSQNMSASFRQDPYSYSGVTDPLNADEYRDLIPDSIKVNENTSSNWSHGTNYNFSGALTFNRRLRGAPWFGESGPTGYNGRNISARINLSTSGNKNDNWNQSFVNYHQQDSIDVIFRNRVNPSSNRNFTAGFTYSEPVVRGLFAQVNYSYNYSKRKSDGDTYDFADNDSIGKLLWDYYELNGSLPDTLTLQNFRSKNLSRYSDNENYINRFEFQMRLNTGVINATAGVNVENQTQKLHQIYMGRDLEGSRNYTRVSPTANVNLRFTRQHTLRFTYRGNSQQPNMTDLFDIEDNSNPLNIRRGNPNLKPSFRNELNLDYNNYFQETKRSYNFRFSYNNTANSIENMTEYNEQTGGRITTPVNIDDSDWNINTNAGFNTPLFWEQFTASINGNYGFTNNVGYVYQNKQTMKNLVTSNRAGGRLTLTWRMTYFDIRANGNINWNQSRSELVQKSNQSNYSFNYGLSSTGNFENGFGYSTDISVHSRRGYSSPAMNTNEFVWNIQLSYRFLKRRATITLAAYDILNKRSNINRSVDGDGRRDTENNSIHSYYLATFRYRFNIFGNKESRQALNRQRQELRDIDGERPAGRGERGERGFGGNRGGFGGGNRGGF